MQPWNVEHSVFAVEQFFRNNDSVATVRLFRRQFNVARDGAIPDRNTILRWVESFRTTGSVMKRATAQNTHCKMEAKFLLADMCVAGAHASGFTRFS